jgi:hypothetical protein
MDKQKGRFYRPFFIMNMPIFLNSRRNCRSRNNSQLHFKRFRPLRSQRKFAAKFVRGKEKIDTQEFLFAKTPVRLWLCNHCEAWHTIWASYLLPLS